jgi:hypothetical protein
MSASPAPGAALDALLAAYADRLADLVADRVLARLADRAEPALLDRAGLARALAISPASLDTLRRREGFPEIRVLDAPRFELAAVLEWLHARGAP